MLHLVSGDMGLKAWDRAGLPGQALVWRDSPAMGPWEPDPVRRAALRAPFWGLPESTVAFRDEEVALQAIGQAGAAVLWFSDEPWDQMAQLWVVARLTRMPSLPALERALLREGGSGVPPAAMGAALAGRLPLTLEDREEAARLWDRFEAGDWPGLRQWLDQGRALDSLPWLGPALTRVLEDRPPHVPGRTERQVRDLMAAGVADLSGMMRALAALEAPYGMAWYGDLVVRNLMTRIRARST